MNEIVYDASAAEQAGVTEYEEVMFDYFGFEERTNFYLSDNKQYFVLSKMNEGARARFQKETRTDAKFSRRTDDVTISADPAAERHALIKACVVDWNLYRKDPRTGKYLQVPFSTNTLGQFLNSADPKVVDELEKACRDFNPWLLSELTVEAIDKEIARLNEQRDELIKQESGEGASSSR